MAAPPRGTPAIHASAPAPRSSERAVRRLQSDLQAIFDARINRHAQWSVLVRSIDSGERLFQREPEKLMMPASNMKIVTLAVAADVLGWDSRFTTTLETSASIVDGVLTGDLYVRGGGDPTLNTRYGRGEAIFREWAAALRRHGIHRIEGRLVGDDRLFDDERLGYGWSWDDLQYDYAAPVSALQWNENSVELTLRPGPAIGSPAIVVLAPGSGLTVASRALTTPSGVPATIEYRRRAEAPVLDVWGTIPLPSFASDGSIKDNHLSEQIAVVEPARFFAEALKHALQDQGIDVIGPAVGVRAQEGPREPSTRRVLARAESPPLREIATVLMKVSQNLYAETLLKLIGVEATGVGTTEAGKAAVVAVLENWGIDPASLIMADGSGLSRYNYVTPETLVRILERVHGDSRHREAFLTSLPRAGREGTVSRRMRGSRAEGNAAAKTGSLSNVRALSGFVETRDGETLAFSIIANGFGIPPETVTWIADLAVEVLANFSRRG